jgi:hypothetical protein
VTQARLEEEELIETAAKANPWFDFEATGETDNPTETPARRTVRAPKGHENNPTQWLGGKNAETQFSKHTMTHNKCWQTIKPADMAKVMKGTERKQKASQNPQHKKAMTNAPPSNELTRESIDAMRQAYQQVLIAEQKATPAHQRNRLHGLETSRLCEPGGRHEFSDMRPCPPVSYEMEKRPAE